MCYAERQSGKTKLTTPHKNALKYRTFQSCNMAPVALQPHTRKNRLIQSILLFDGKKQEKADLFFLNYIPYFAV